MAPLSPSFKPLTERGFAADISHMTVLVPVQAYADVCHECADARIGWRVPHMLGFFQLGSGTAMQTEFLKVTGMTCGACTSKVPNALNAIPGVGDVKVSLAAGEATVRYDERMTSPDQLKSAVKGAGYGVDMTNAAHGQPFKGDCCA